MSEATDTKAPDDKVVSSSDGLVRRLRGRYTAPPPPKCRVCGGEMQLGMLGQGRAEWYCGSDAANSSKQEPGTHGAGLAADHYWSSQEIVCQFGDRDVLALCDAFDALSRTNIKDQV
jgi:hypothetical protein